MPRALTLSLLAWALVACGQATTVTPGPVADDAPLAAAPRQALATTAPRSAEPSLSDAAPPPATPPPPPPPPRPTPREHGVSGLIDAIPPLLWRGAQETEEAWYAVKDVRDPVEQAKALADSRLERTACRGLVDFRLVAPDRTAPFGYRDDVRGRSWARPALAAVLVRALEALRAESPAATVSIGDMAQPGCGQLEHGTLVRLVSDLDPAPPPPRHLPAPTEPQGAATALLNRARLVISTATVWELKRARDLRQEAWRLDFLDAPVLLEHRLLARDAVPDPTGEPRLRLKVSTRRYRPIEEPSDQLERDLLRVGTRMMEQGVLVSTERARTWDPDEGDVPVWVQRWVLVEGRRQMITVSDRRLKRRFTPTTLRDVRLGGWHGRKPGSMDREIRWLADRAESAPGARPRWTRWQKLYEAGHITHLGGRDVDVSYVTSDPKRHFAVDLEAMDVEATWRWFGHLDAAATAMGVRIDRILVDPSVRRLLKRKLPKQTRGSRLWRLIRLANGHDAHHHLRITPPSPRSHDAALQLLASPAPAPSP
jgi:hypothetical protein